MIKHKREEFLSDSGHRALMISGLFWGCAAIDSVRMYGKMSEEIYDGMGMGFLIPAILFAVLSVFFLLRGILKAGERKKKAMESKQDFIQNGILSHGKIMSAGGGYYQKGHYRQQHIRQQKSRYFYVWESRWWAEIEYYDEAKGTYARYRTSDLNRNPKLYVGKDVDIYRLAESVYVDFN